MTRARGSGVPTTGGRRRSPERRAALAEAGVRAAHGTAVAPGSGTGPVLPR